MTTLIRTLWDDTRGAVVSIETISIAVIAVTGLIVGLTSIRDGVICELSDFGGAVQSLVQGFEYRGADGHSSQTVGANFEDRVDFCDARDGKSGQADNCIVFDEPPADES